MRLSIKSLKTVKTMSEETLCFSATLLSDGKPVATVSNRGQGGPHEYRPTNHALFAAVEKWATSQPMEFDFEKLDQIVDKLVAREAVASKLRRLVKRETLFRLKGDARGAWRTIISKDAAGAKAFVEKKYGDAVEFVVTSGNVDDAVAFC